MAHIADVESCRVFICTGWANPGHHAHLLLLLLLLLFLLDFLNDLLFHQLVDVPPVHQKEAVVAHHLDIERGTKNFTLVLLDYLSHLATDGLAVEIVRNIAHLQNSLPLVIRRRGKTDQPRKLLCFAKLVQLFQDAHQFHRSLDVLRRRGKARWQLEQNRRSHLRYILKESGIKGHFCLRLFLSQPIDPFH